LADKSGKRNIILGVDPGIRGAICVFDVSSDKIIDIHDIPTYKKATNARAQGFFEYVDAHLLVTLVEKYAKSVAMAVLEEPGAMPKQGLSSTFNFGHTCGIIHGALAGCYLPVVPVKPQVWKLAMGLSSDKEDTRRRASLEFPNEKVFWPLKKHHDRAEAALLALYGVKYLSKLIEQAQ
jgi:crossover junction endodeoxyribonuclease RuvC